MSSSRPESPLYQAGCRMPSDRGIEREEANRRTEAEIANDRFVATLRRCIWNGGAG